MMKQMFVLYTKNIYLYFNLHNTYLNTLLLIIVLKLAFESII